MFVSWSHPAIQILKSPFKLSKGFWEMTAFILSAWLFCFSFPTVVLVMASSALPFKPGFQGTAFTMLLSLNVSVLGRGFLGVELEKTSLKLGFFFFFSLPIYSRLGENPALQYQYSRVSYYSTQNSFSFVPIKAVSVRRPFQENLVIEILCRSLLIVLCICLFTGSN